MSSENQLNSVDLLDFKLNIRHILQIIGTTIYNIFTKMLFGYLPQISNKAPSTFEQNEYYHHSLNLNLRLFIGVSGSYCERNVLAMIGHSLNGKLR